MVIERAADREAYVDDHTVIAEMPAIGWTRPRRSGAHGLGPHRHPGRWELCWLARGEVDWWVEAESHAVARGECYVTRPDELHGGQHDLLQPCELFWMHVRLDRAGRLPGFDVDDLAGRLAALPRVFPGDRALTAALWWDVLRELREPDAWTPAATRAALHRLLLAILRSGARHAEPTLSPEIARATAIARRLDARVRVADLARAARLSPSRFHARFIAEVGEPPAAWLRRQRLRLAKRLLQEGRPVTEVAMATGFPTSQWFATVFRRYTGVAPSEWRGTGTPT